VWRPCGCDPLVGPEAYQLERIDVNEPEIGQFEVRDDLKCQETELHEGVVERRSQSMDCREQLIHLVTHDLRGAVRHKPTDGQRHRGEQLAVVYRH